MLAEISMESLHALYDLYFYCLQAENNSLKIYLMCQKEGKPSNKYEH
jgi:hypothetical protein